MPSTSPGYLLPDASPAPLVDDALEDFLHDVFAGITGMANELVRPRWQEEPPNQPDISADWLAFGVFRVAGDTYAYEAQGDSTSELQRHETIEVLLSFYGPNAMKNMLIFRDGLLIEQNRAALVANGMGLIETGEGRPAPVIPKDRWIHRWDMMMMFRRQVRRTYQILPLLSAQGSIQAEPPVGLIQTNFQT